MSKIGSNPIQFDKSKITVTVEEGGEYNHRVVNVTDGKNTLNQSIRKGVDIKVDEGVVTLVVTNASKQAKAYHGLYRSIISNLIQGLVEGYEKKLEIHGVGYRGNLSGNKITMNLGNSHQTIYTVREGVEVTMPDESSIVIKGIDKQLVGQVAAEIRELRKPEPYKGKGIRYSGEAVRRKAGKSGSA